MALLGNFVWNLEDSNYAFDSVCSSFLYNRTTITTTIASLSIYSFAVPRNHSSCRKRHRERTCPLGVLRRTWRLVSSPNGPNNMCPQMAIERMILFSPNPTCTQAISPPALSRLTENSDISEGSLRDRSALSSKPVLNSTTTSRTNQQRPSNQCTNYYLRINQSFKEQEVFNLCPTFADYDRQRLLLVEAESALMPLCYEDNCPLVLVWSCLQDYVK